MDQIAFFLYFMLFSLGLVSLFISVFVYFRYGNRMIRYFFFLFFIFTLRILMNNILLFNIINSREQNSGLILLLYSLSSDILFIGLIILPILLHTLLKIKHLLTSNLIIFLLLAFSLVFTLYPYLSPFFAEKDSVFLFPAIQSVMTFIPFIIIIYSAVLIAVRWKDTDKEYKEIAFILLLFFATLTVFDAFIPHKLFIFSIMNGLSMQWILLSFCFYFVWNILFLAYSFKFLSGPSSRKRYEELKPDWLEQKGITGREKEIIELVLQGKSNTEIAEKLFVSLKTVKSHVYNIFKKLEIKSRMELVHITNRIL